MSEGSGPADPPPPQGAGATLKYSSHDAPGAQAVHLAPPTRASTPLTSALEDERGATDLQSVDEEKKHESLQGLNPGCSLTLLTGQHGGGGKHGDC